MIFVEVRHVGDLKHFQQNAAVRSMSVSNIHFGNWHNIKHCSWNILNPASWHVTVDQFKHCSHGNSSLLLIVNPCQGCGYMVSWTVLIIKCTSGTCKTEHELEVCQINVPSAGSHFRRSVSNSLRVNYSLYKRHPQDEHHVPLLSRYISESSSGFLWHS